MRESGNFNLGSELLGNGSSDESTEDVLHDNAPDPAISLLESSDPPALNSDHHLFRHLVSCQHRCGVARRCRVSARLQQRANVVGSHARRSWHYSAACTAHVRQEEILCQNELLNRRELGEFVGDTVPRESWTSVGILQCFQSLRVSWCQTGAFQSLSPGRHLPQLNHVERPAERVSHHRPRHYSCGVLLCSRHHSSNSRDSSPTSRPIHRSEKGPFCPPTASWGPIRYVPDGRATIWEREKRASDL